MAATITAPRVWTATRDDVPDIITTLSLAFQDDPIFAWAMPDPARRRAVLPAVFTLFAEAHVRYGATYATSGGAAMWTPSGVDPIRPPRAEAFMSAMSRLLGPDAARMATIAELSSAHRPVEPSAHLQFLGVEPDLQGRGLGTWLMSPMLAACDRGGVPAHLNATSERSRALYERNGFVVVEELRASDAPPLWSMWRDPQRGA